MRIATLSLDFGLLLLVLVALFHTQGISAAPEFNCGEQCIISEQCEMPIYGGRCGRSAEICCSVVKNEFRTACRHHGGECMDYCNSALVREVNDCPANQQCCVLV